MIGVDTLDKMVGYFTPAQWAELMAGIRNYDAASLAALSGFWEKAIGDPGTKLAAVMLASHEAGRRSVIAAVVAAIGKE